MEGINFIAWLLNWSEVLLPFEINMLLHSTIIVLTGLFMKFLLRKKGAAIQLFCLQVCLYRIYKMRVFLDKR